LGDPGSVDAFVPADDTGRFTDAAAGDVAIGDTSVPPGPGDCTNTAVESGVDSAACHSDAATDVGDADGGDANDAGDADADALDGSDLGGEVSP
jgi:hypothetical protein